MDARTILIHACSDDIKKQEQAYALLKGAEQKHYGGYLIELAKQMKISQDHPDVQQMASVCLKNSICDKNNIQKWGQLNDDTRVKIKNACFTTLDDDNERVRGCCGLVLNAIASIEIPARKWDSLIPLLSKTISESESWKMKESCLICLGLISDSCYQYLGNQSDDVLKGISTGLTVNNKKVFYSAAQALRAAIRFSHKNFSKQEDRDAILKMVVGIAKNKDAGIRKVGFQCMVNLAVLFYDHLSGDHLGYLYNLQKQAISTDVEEVRCQAIEFWIAICENEQEMVYKNRNSKGFVSKVLKDLTPLLLNCLLKQQSSLSESDATVNDSSKFATLCIIEFAQLVGNDIVKTVIDFVELNYKETGNKQDEWRNVDAAMTAFGSILKGPNPDDMKGYVSNLMSILLKNLKSKNEILSRTAAWTLGRVCELCPAGIGDAFGQLMAQFLEGLDYHEKTASIIAWAIAELANHIPKESDSTPLSGWIEKFMIKLFVVAQDVLKPELCHAAYECIKALIETSGNDCLDFIAKALEEVLKRISKFLGMFDKINKVTDKQKLLDIVSYLCNVLRALIGRITQNVCEKNSDNIMTIVMGVLGKSRTSGGIAFDDAYECAMELNSRIGSVFGDRYMGKFYPYMIYGLKSTQTSTICIQVTGSLDEFCTNIQYNENFYVSIMEILVMNLRAGDIDRIIKPPIFSAIGDLAMVLNDKFAYFLPSVMKVISSAQSQPIEEKDEQDREFVRELRQSLGDAYTGILHLALEKEDVIEPYIGQLLTFFKSIAQYPEPSQELLVTCCGIIGDAAHVSPVKYHKYFIQKHIKDLVLAVGQIQEKDAQKNYKWAAEQLRDIEESLNQQR